MIRRTIAVAAALLAVVMLSGPPASAGLGIHTTSGAAFGSGFLVSVNATEPGLGSVTVNGTNYVVTCMHVSPFQALPGGAHDIFIKAVNVSPNGTVAAVFIRILDVPVGTDQHGVNFVGLTFGIACDADQNVAPVLTGGYTTTP